MKTSAKNLLVNWKILAFDGLAVGGLAVGEGQETMFEVLDFTMPKMPTDKPRYLMGGRQAR